MKKVYILILNYNGWEDTIECLESVLRLDYANLQVVVVDNNSPNNSQEYIKEWAEGKLFLPENNNKALKYLFISPLNKPIDYEFFHNKDFGDKETIKLVHKLTIIQAGSNEGFAAGNNIFLTKVFKEDAYVWILNPDIVVEPDSLKHLLSSAMNHGDNSVIGSVVKNYSDPEQLLFYGGGKVNLLSGTISFKTDRNKIELDYISGGSLFTHLSNFKKLGLLPEGYFLYWEETDWCRHAKLNNIKFYISYDSIVYDKISTAIGKGFLAEYYYTLNALKFIKKYFPEYTLFPLFLNIFRAGKRIFEGRFENFKAILQASMNFILNRSLKR